MKLDGKIVVLTGSAAGIGQALLNELKTKNCKIIAADISYASQIQNEANITYYKCDVSDLTQLSDLFYFVQQKYGKPDVFIANAGFAYYGRTESLTDEQIQRIFNLNTVSVIAATTNMQKTHSAQPFNMVIIASAMSHWSVPGYAAYSATKAALVGFAKAFRYELYSGQRLQVVYPIGTKSNFFRNAGNSPKPIIRQTTKQVAVATIRGIESDTDDIYPSAIFWTFMHLNRIFSFIRPLVLWVENKNFRAWLNDKNAF